MKNKLPCELVQDLFPSYIDGLTSEVTNTMVEDHIAECETCRNTLDAMREPSAEPVNPEEKQEIDFLKKTKKKTRIVVLGCVLASIMIIAAVLAAKIFLIGSYAYSETVACQVSVDGNCLSLSGVTADERLGVSSIAYKEEDGVVTVSFKVVKKSPFHKGEFQSEYEASETITQVCLDERIIWSQGETISAMASAVYNTRHAYVGSMPENLKTANALNMSNYLGKFTNELRTGEEPYIWKINLENKISASQQEKKERDMRSYAYILLAVIDNLGEVTYEYTLKGEVYPVIVTVTEEEASAFAGGDIKECGQDAASLQKLIQKTGLDTYAYVSDDSQWHTQDTIQVEIINHTDGDIAGISLTYSVDGILYGTMGAENADHTMIEKGDVMYFTFIPDDFGGVDLDAGSDITVEAEVYDNAGNCYPVSDPFHIVTEFGLIYQYTLSGNSVDGYVISQ